VSIFDELQGAASTAPSEPATGSQSPEAATTDSQPAAWSQVFYTIPGRKQKSKVFSTGAAREAFVASMTQRGAQVNVVEAPPGSPAERNLRNARRIAIAVAAGVVVLFVIGSLMDAHKYRDCAGTSGYDRDICKATVDYFDDHPWMKADQSTSSTEDPASASPSNTWSDDEAPAVNPPTSTVDNQDQISADGTSGGLSESDLASLMGCSNDGLRLVPGKGYAPCAPHD